MVQVAGDRRLALLQFERPTGQRELLEKGGNLPSSACSLEGGDESGVCRSLAVGRNSASSLEGVINLPTGDLIYRELPEER